MGWIQAANNATYYENSSKNYTDIESFMQDITGFETWDTIIWEFILWWNSHSLRINVNERGEISITDMALQPVFYWNILQIQEIQQDIMNQEWNSERKAERCREIEARFYEWLKLAIAWYTQTKETTEDTSERAMRLVA